jgi:hypothetical protein
MFMLKARVNCLATLPGQLYTIGRNLKKLIVLNHLRNVGAGNNCLIFLGRDLQLYGRILPSLSVPSGFNRFRDIHTVQGQGAECKSLPQNSLPHTYKLAVSPARVADINPSLCCMSSIDFCTIWGVKALHRSCLH